MTPVAAVDVGTNSVRLLVARRGADAPLEVVDRRLALTRLGQGVDASGSLAEEAIDRTVAAVSGFAAVWRDAGVERVRITATSAARDAANAAVLVEGIRRVAGVAPEVLSGTAEADLAFRGATAGLRGHPGPYAVIDIGGGSTEVVVGQAAAERSTSRQLGCVRLTERVLTTDPPTDEQVVRARRAVAEELDAVAAEVDPAGAGTLIGVAGTVTTLAALDADLPAYADGAVHGRWLGSAALGGWTRRLLDTSAAAIGRLGPVQAGREDVLAAGALILDEVVQRFGFSGVVVSESDTLDGVAMALLDDAGG